MKLNLRTIHRDLGYFYVGLIISFAFSGILMNHRSSWHPEKFTVETKQIHVTLPFNKKDVTDAFIENIAKTLKIDDKLKRHTERKGELRIMFDNTDVNIDLKSGDGDITTFRKTPFISQIMNLHKSTSNW